MKKDRFLSVEDIAAILSVTPKTVVDRYINDFGLKAIQLGRIYRVRESDFKEFVGIDPAEEIDWLLPEKK